MSSIWKIFKESLDGSEKDYTSGSINRAIVLLAIPMVLEMAMESLFALVDIFFVGQLGPEAAAAVGLTEAVSTIIYSLAVGLSMAATAMVARRIGERKPDAASWAAVQAIWIGVAISVVLGILGFAFARQILVLMGGSESLVAAGAGYTRIILGANIVITLLFLLNGIFRGAGEAALAMRSLWIANIINIILDPILIFGWGPIPAMGIEGAAIATVIGRGTGVAYQLYILFKDRSMLRVLKRHLLPQWTILGRLARVAIGGAGQHIIASASWIFMIRLVAVFGDSAIAGYTFAVRLIVFTILPSWGMANAAATLVGQNLGAGHPDRAETSVWRAAFYNMIFLGVVSLTFFLAAPQLIGMFTTDQQAIDIGVLCLRIISLGYTFFSYGMVISQAFNGAGDTRTPTFINLFCFWLMEIPLGYILSVVFNLGPAGVFAAISISETTLALISVLLFRRGRWKAVHI